LQWTLNDIPFGTPVTRAVDGPITMTYAWGTQAVRTGPYTLGAKAKNAAGAEVVATPHKFEVRNPSTVIQFSAPGTYLLAEEITGRIYVVEQLRAVANSTGATLQLVAGQGPTCTDRRVVLTPLLSTNSDRMIEVVDWLIAPAGSSVCAITSTSTVIKGVVNIATR
jgi:hypothetical protein